MAAAEASSWGWSNDAQPEQQQEQPQQAQDTAWSWSGEASAASNAASAPAAHEAPSAPAEDGNGGWSDTWTKGGSDNAASTDAPTDKWHTEGDPWSKKGVEGSANAGSADTPAQDTSGSAWNKWDNQQGDAPAQGGGNNGSSWNNWSGGGGAAASNGNHASNGASNWDWGGAPQEKKPMENIAKAQRQRLLAGCQAFNAAQGLLSRLRDDELAELDSKLFEEDRLTGAGVDFDTVYADVPCVIKGPKTENIPPISTFSDLYTMFKEQIPPSLEDNIKRCRYHKPTPVQRYVLPCAFSGRDIMCCAQTGSGKTVAYLIPVLASMIRSHINAVGDLQEPYSGPVKPDCVIIAPTRELTLQIFDDARRFCHRTPYRVIRVYGQEAAKEQLADVAKGADVVIGTPGRLWDYVSAEVIDVKQVNCLVLDEADRMLDRGMSQWIRPTVSEYGMPDKENRQTMMFSATFPPEVQTLAQEYLYEHVWVGVGVIGGAVTTVTQQLMKITASKKFDRLMELIDEWFVERDNSGDSGARLMVFVNSKRQAKALDEYLFEKCSIDTCALHADLDQKKREEHLQSFRKGDIDVLVCTDVASRGLDIGGVNTVVNFDIPKDIGTYVQRIGRTGRIGHRGKAISFVTTGEDGNLWDDSNVLRDLVGVMKDANNAVPDWLESQFNAKGAEQAWDSWDNSKSWRQEQNQRDVRENQ
mmetsp:Transcript_61765/g.147345  ORF Transcript_61765/g.147345 Transcript_61765/m.147345 type:complete len:699 (+) Transcript_61765:107-2203(+)